MRAVIALAAAAIAAFPAAVLANQPQYYNPRPPPPFPECPAFFSTTITTNLSAPTYGPMTNSIHYTLTTQRVNYGRNTYLQLRLYSNVQDTAIRNLQFCQALVTWDPRTGNPTKPAPQFKNRVRYSPRVKGTQPAITSSPITGQQYINTTTFPGLTQYCVTVPYLKPKGRQKVDFLWYTDPCLLSARWIGWVNFQNPYNPSQTCEADVNREKPGQPLNRVNAIRTLDSTNKDISKRCDTYPY